MKSGWCVIILALGIARFSCSQFIEVPIAVPISAPIGGIPIILLPQDRIVESMNVDGNVTRSEVDSVFQSGVGGSLADRCRFVNWLMTEYGESAQKASAFFSAIQSTANQVNSDDFVKVILQDKTIVPTSVAMDNINKFYVTIGKVISKPADYTSGPSYFPYKQFDVQRWTNFTDQNNDGMISTLEISYAMRNLDLNNDWNIQLCEFVTFMLSYNMHAVTASKVYVLLFDERDTTWADVDSNFLQLMITKHKYDTPTRKEYASFFGEQNQISAGIPLDPDEDPYWMKNWVSGQHTGGAFMCVTSSVLAVLLVTLFS